MKKGILDLNNKKIKDIDLSEKIFGIKTNDDVKWFNKYSNGAVVGSHILNHINADEDYVLRANEIINSLSKSS